MSKSPDAFRTISEVADWLGVQAHVLRFWESKFAQVKPVKRAGGRRYYRPADMQLLGGIKKLLHDDGLTIKGAQKVIREQGVAEVSALSPPLDAAPGSIEAEPAGATIVRFTGRAEDTEAPVTEPAFATGHREAGPGTPDTEEAPDPAAAEPVPAPDRAPISLSLGEEEPAAAPPEDAAPEEDPEAAPVAAAPSPPAAESAPPAETAPPAPETPKPEAPEEAARLPSFLHRAAPPPPAPPGTSGASPGPAAAGPASESPPADTAPRARAIEAPDPPQEADMPASPGLLTRLSALRALSPAEAAQIAPLAGELRTWLQRQERPRAG